MTIGELAKRTGVKSHQLRRLMDSGTIPSKRPPGGHRRVDESALPGIMKMLAAFGLIEESTRKK